MSCFWTNKINTVEECSEVATSPYYIARVFWEEYSVYEDIGTGLMWNNYTKPRVWLVTEGVPSNDHPPSQTWLLPAYVRPDDPDNYSGKTALIIDDGSRCRFPNSPIEQISWESGDGYALFSIVYRDSGFLVPASEINVEWGVYAETTSYDYDQWDEETGGYRIIRTTVESASSIVYGATENDTPYSVGQLCIDPSLPTNIGFVISASIRGVPVGNVAYAYRTMSG